MPTVLHKSGKNGKIRIGSSDLSAVRNWTFSLESNNPQFGTSTSAGHKVSVAGVKSGTVSFNIVLDFNDSVFDRVKPGDSASLELFEDDTRKWTVPVRIDSISEEVEMDDGNEVTCACEASTNGAWTYPDGTVSA